MVDMVEEDRLAKAAQRLSPRAKNGGSSSQRLSLDRAWEPNVITDKTGKATVKLKFPDSLTVGLRPRELRLQAIIRDRNRKLREQSNR